MQADEAAITAIEQRTAEMGEETRTLSERRAAYEAQITENRVAIDAQIAAAAESEAAAQQYRAMTLDCEQKAAELRARIKRIHRSFCSAPLQKQKASTRSP